MFDCRSTWLFSKIREKHLHNNLEHSVVNMSNGKVCSHVTLWACSTTQSTTQLTPSFTPSFPPTVTQSQRWAWLLGVQCLPQGHYFNLRAIRAVNRPSENRMACSTISVPITTKHIQSSSASLCAFKQCLCLVPFQTSLFLRAWMLICFDTPLSLNRLFRPD